MSEMTGLERLRALGREQEERSWSTVGKVRGRLMLQIAEQIEDERFREQLAVERVASEMELHCLGVEGMEDSPVARWARELREALGGRDEEVTDVATIRKDAMEAYEWVSVYGGLEKVKLDAACWNTAENIAQTTLDWLARVCPVAGIEKCGYGIALEKLEDAINRRLTPEGMEWLVEAWPRFEDNEPVRFGDEWLDGGGKTHVLHEVVLMDEDAAGSGAKALLRGSTTSVLDGVEYNVWPHERVKRPAPKVLDADGAEIREKCDVWWICEGDERGVHAERLRVETICPNGLIECSPYNGGTWVYLEPSELYVNKPVPSSDGRPLREGDYVWDMRGNGPYEVVGFTKSGYVRIKSDFGLEQSAFGERLTHERPDSWKRLEEDMGDEMACQQCGPISPELACSKAAEFVRRARALAERDA